MHEFEVNLNKVQKEFEESKKTAANLRVEYESKLEDRENDHEDEINNIKMKHKDMKMELEGKWRGLEVEQTQEKKLKEELEAKKERAIDDMERAKQQEKEIETKLEEKIK